MASWPRPRPVPRMKLTGSVTIPDERASPLPLFSAFRVTQVNRAVSPRLTTTKMISVQTVDLTERIFVHSASITPAKPAQRAWIGAGAWVAVTVVIGCLPNGAPRHATGRGAGCRFLGRRGRVAAVLDAATRPPNRTSGTQSRTTVARFA